MALRACGLLLSLALAGCGTGEDNDRVYVEVPGQEGDADAVDAVDAVDTVSHSSDGPDAPGPDTGADAAPDTASCSTDCDPGGAPFGGGCGTDEHPWLICTAAQLAEADHSQYLDDAFRLSADIDMDEIAPAEYKPIGDIMSPFTGTFDGNHKTISNLTIDAPNRTDQGLFGATLNSTIKDLDLVNVSVAGGEAVGALVGWNIGIVTNCSATGEVTATADAVGGLVGANGEPTFRSDDPYGLIRFSHASVDVSSDGSMVGGLVGRCNWDSGVNSSFASGDVSGLDEVGGLIGAHRGGVMNSYATGDVSGRNMVGGLTGSLETYGTLRQTYSLGRPSGIENVGGLTGEGGFSVYDSYWNIET
ncbi:MAG: GLUG motif-containing protein, partial [Persicimonas sp.]